MDSSDHPPPEHPRPGQHPDTEPDYRFTLANERTFLAWVRTSLAFLAAGVAVRQLVPPFGLPAGRSILAAACVVTSIVLALGGLQRWRSVQQAMRRDEPLPRSLLFPVLTGALLLIAVLTVVMVLS